MRSLSELAAHRDNLARSFLAASVAARCPLRMDCILQGQREYKVQVFPVILFRARAWGSGEWTRISIGGEEDGDIERSIASILGSALSTSSLHVQQMNGEGTWEDLE